MDDDVAWLEPAELEAWVGFIRVAARVVALADASLHRAHGITGRDYELLHHLSAAPTGLRISELAGLIDDTSSCITHRVNRLVTAGLVDKRADPDDQRARRALLTRAGRRLLAEAAPAHVERVRRWVFDPLTARDVADLARVTRKLEAHLREIEPLE